MYHRWWGSAVGTVRRPRRMAKKVEVDVCKMNIHLLPLRMDSTQKARVKHLRLRALDMPEGETR